MESKLKVQCMDSVGELPAGYPHLPTTPIKQETKLTDWFDGEKFIPANVGIYEENRWSALTDDFAKIYWNGEKWFCPDFTMMNEPPKAFNGISANQSPQWRGIKK
jgi:hypothetical protein